MPKTTYTKKIKRIIIQVGDLVEVFEIDDKENMKLSRKQNEEKINSIKIKMIENNLLDDRSTQEPSSEQANSDKNLICEENICDNNQNQNDIVASEFEITNDERLFFDEELDSFNIFEFMGE